MTPRALLRIALGLVFIVASLDKALNPQAFASIVYDYQLVPDLLVNPLALLLPWVELLAGLCLVFDMLTLGASFLAFGLMTVFLGALGINAARGLSVACGCFSTKTGGGGDNLWYLLRDTGLFVLSALVLRLEWARARSNIRLS
ncbi:methylamine utilization MauE [Desulfovibrio sp. X2]|uniref:MauE/DoxX family redox-associated membrane protein n=1 Tax=Desulfovibrio sp. X2 TaxID=941449 RepID=UPI000358BAFE|nr:MauE/DoxX family redox-associated membrane protein [Desulfovibrio sp. X2]EPR37434.1 methylamine utilization MauE [Desulfovibrio sp. X2]